MHKVKCTECGEMFDRDKVTTVRVSNKRYAHSSCIKDISSIQKKLESSECKGVYGIYSDDCLLYVGMTTVSFYERWKQHINNINSLCEGSKPLYKRMSADKASGCNVRMEPIVIIKPTDNFNKTEIQIMEMMTIKFLKPIYNISGVSIPYKFNEHVSFTP